MPVFSVVVGFKWDNMHKLLEQCLHTVDCSVTMMMVMMVMSLGTQFLAPLSSACFLFLFFFFFFWLFLHPSSSRLLYLVVE